MFHFFKNVLNHLKPAANLGCFPVKNRVIFIDDDNATCNNICKSTNFPTQHSKINDDAGILHNR